MLYFKQSERKETRSPFDKYWNMEYGTWNMEHGIWNMEYGTWNMEYGIISNCRLKLEIFNLPPATLRKRAYSRSDAGRFNFNLTTLILKIIQITHLFFERK
ncbi:hypothetical protein KKA09_01980 [Patescibacteria group bacterium]|nr:hypothetical protein [Patescibacteria group bacterium]